MAQKNCRIAFDEIDAFDSLRTVASEVVPFGYFIPSKYETENGPKFIAEAEAIVVYAENDSISGFFFNIILPEYKLQQVAYGTAVKFLLDDKSIVGFENYPDEGEFDRSSNMRRYQHACPIPLDYYYRLAYHKIWQIRVEYQKQVHTIILSEEQQEALRLALQCVGKEVGLYPIQP